MFYHLVDRVQDPAGPSVGVADSQSGRFAEEADAGAEDELGAVGCVGAHGLAFVEGGDVRAFLVGKVVPAVADVGEFGVYKLLEDVAVEEDVFVDLMGRGMCKMVGVQQGKKIGW